MRERPILFSGEMVRAILKGRKTQTRRVIDFELNELHSLGNPVQLLGDWPLSNVGEFRDGYLNYQVQTQADDYSSGKVKCPYGQPGDRLWVKETWYYEVYMHDLTAGKPDLPGGRYSHRYVYRADSPNYPVNDGWKPSRYMERCASRITLEIEDIRVERVQDITEDDAMAEGCEKLLMETRSARNNFMNLWNFINSKRGYGWEANPLVWVVEFHRIGGRKT